MKLFDLDPEALEWDSEFFEIPIFKCRINGSFSQKHKDQLNLLEATLVYVGGTSDSCFDEEKSISFVDRKVTFKKEILSKEYYRHNSPLLTFDDEKFIDRNWYDLIFSSGLKSRFFCDELFPRRKSEKLYLQWVKNAINDPNSVFLVLRYKEVVAGFVTFSCQENDATIGLIAVRQEFYRMKLGLALLRECQNRLLKLRIKNLYVTTQCSNVPAIKFYESFGFSKDKQEILGHFWLT